MIRIIDKPPVKFGKIVREFVENVLSEYGFVFDDYEIPVYNSDGIRLSPEEIEEMFGFIHEEETNLPLPISQDEADVHYSREREGISEFIGFTRQSYSDKYDKDCDDEVEKTPYLTDENDASRNSRHLFEVTLSVNRGYRNLLTTGEAGIGRNGEEYWYFEDEEDLRNLLAEKIVPLLQTVAMTALDEKLENELEYLAKSPKAKHLIR